VARRQQRLRALADALGAERASWVAVDLTDEGAPAQIADHVREGHGRLDLLVNNAGASWRARFGDGGYENVRRTMAVNFDAQLRVTEALLGLLRSSAPSAIVNVASTAARVARAGTGAYSASKAALVAWSDALSAEEHANGVHVALVLPGFIATEGFPQTELTSRPLTSWIVSTPDKAAEAIFQAGIGRRPERYVPRPYALAAALRILTPGLVRRALGGSAAAVMTTTTGADMADRAAQADGTAQADSTRQADRAEQADPAEQADRGAQADGAEQATRPSGA
jgi:short-subunit dehydrogenase